MSMIEYMLEGTWVEVGFRDAPHLKTELKAADADKDFN